MEYQTLTTEAQGKTLMIRINRPEVYNALNSQVLDDLDQVMDHLKNNSNYAGAILTGAGEKAFAAGADIAEVNGLPALETEIFSRRGQLVFNKIETSGKPVIAAVHGFALGGGCELAMACHMRIASEKAKFGQPEVNLGLIAGYGGTQRLVRLVGRTKASELLLTGDHIGAQEAFQLGLVNYVTTKEDMLPKATEILEKIYTKSPLAVSLTLEAIHAGCLDQEQGYEMERKNFGIAASSHDGKEGTKAFLEKRKPEFSGT